MIIDCFSFFNELKILKFRLEELYDKVDYFVIAESTMTHSGNPKPLFFNDNKILFEKYLNKIIHVIVEFPVNLLDGDWDRERYQRDYLVYGIDKVPNITDNDLIIISDADEIPNIDSIKNTKISDMTNGCHLSQDFYYYNLNYKKERKWHWSVVVPFSKVKKNKLSDLRWSHTNMPGIQSGGWHFSYFGSVGNIVTKLNSFAHQEFNDEHYKDEKRILECINNGLDLFERDDSEKLIYVDVNNNSLPKNYGMLL